MATKEKRLDDLERRARRNSNNGLPAFAVVYRDGEHLYDKCPGDPDRRRLSATELDELRASAKALFIVCFDE